MLSEIRATSLYRLPGVLGQIFWERIYEVRSEIGVKILDKMCV